jgi:hypothetical protein
MITKNSYYFFFFISIIARLIHLNYSGYNYDFCCDVPRYLNLSDNIINHNYNLLDDLFIVAPFYPYYLALLKIINNENFITILISTQILISSVSTVFIMKITKEIFKEKKIIYISGLIYSIYPTTLFYTHMIGQETFFQFFFIVSCFFFCKFINKNKKKDLLIFSIFITLSFLTKSHVSIVIIFLLISVILLSKNINNKIYNILIIIITLNIMCFPNAYYNYKKNGVYALSTTGLGLSMSSNSDNFYNFLVEIKNINQLKNSETINFYPPKIDSAQKIKDKEKFWIEEAIKWIKNNPKKFIEMKFYNLYNFILPGVNKNHYTFKVWLFSFLIALPLYIGAYIEICRNTIKDYKKHLLIISVGLGMMSYSVLFFPQDRINYIMLEPLYIVYFSNFIKKILINLKKNIIN